MNAIAIARQMATEDGLERLVKINARIKS